jgi:dTDP-4-amino-4,6-dideoxygalactose transaminase
MPERIYVTRPRLPPLEEFIPFLERIWSSHHLTNDGPFHAELERALAEYLGVVHVSLFVNGTLALVTALQALGIKGEVITTPYSFVATAHSLRWNNIDPVFADIDPDSLNLDPAKVEAAVTPRTTAILPVHCYGRPCDVAAIQKIADRHGLKVIYDAAHAFGVKHEGGSILRFGDMSILSFHATKTFTTFEGGAIVCRDATTKRYIESLKNFGIADEVTVVAPGINGKMNEIQAAFGLLQLKYIDHALGLRNEIDIRYRRELSGVRGIRCLGGAIDSRTNHTYFPILVDAHYPGSRDGLYDRLRQHGVFSRRYFYPLISDMPMYKSLPSSNPENLPVARRTSAEVLCLPIYPDMSMQDQDRVIRIVRKGVAD